MSALRLGIAATAAASLALAGCAGNNTDSDAASTTTAATSAGTTTAAASSTTATSTAATSTAATSTMSEATREATREACEAYVDLGEFDLAPNAPRSMDLVAEYKDVVEDIATDADGAASEAANRLVQAAQQALDTNNADALVTDTYVADNAAIGDWAAENCGFPTVDLTAREFQLDGVPGELPAGTHLFAMENNGQESHLLVVAELRDEYRGNAEEFAALPEEEAKRQTDDYSAGAFAPPGEIGHLAVELERGRYLVFCPETSDDPADQTPHLAKGMIAEFIVQ
jgi:hypothetical protein